jgi:hypothetical protein
MDVHDLVPFTRTHTRLSTGHVGRSHVVRSRGSQRCEDTVTSCHVCVRRQQARAAYPADLLVVGSLHRCI